MKAVFFDVDNVTLNYFKNSDLSVIEPIFIESSLSDEADINFEEIKDAESISVFVHSIDVNAGLLAKFPNLKMVATRSTGYNNIELYYFKKKNIQVCNTPAYGGTTVSEFTFGLILDLIRKISKSAKDFKENSPEINKYMGFDLFGKTIGIIGTGAIGRNTAKIASGFGMNILAYDPYPSDEIKALSNSKYTELDEIFEQSDIISLHAPATPENFHMLNDEAFAKMKTGVIIINTARGDLIDTSALYQNLLNGKVGGAGLDVLEYENFFILDDVYTKNPHDFHKTEMFQSLVNIKIMMHENVIVTPHIAFNSIDAVHRILNITIENINSFTSGAVINSVLK